MRTTTRRTLDRAQGALDFCRAHSDPNPVVAAAVSRLAELLESVLAWLATQGRCQAEAEAARSAGNTLQHELRLRLLALAKFTAMVADREDNPALLIRIPRDSRVGRVRLPEVLKGAISHAREHQDLFERYGLPDHLLIELDGDLREHEAAERNRAKRLATIAEASEALLDLSVEADQIVRHLDALMRIRFAAVPSSLAQWRAASAMQWTRREPSGSEADALV